MSAAARPAGGAARAPASSLTEALRSSLRGHGNARRGARRERGVTRPRESVGQTEDPRRAWDSAEKQDSRGGDRMHGLHRPEKRHVRNEVLGIDLLIALGGSPYRASHSLPSSVLDGTRSARDRFQ